MLTNYQRRIILSSMKSGAEELRAWMDRSERTPADTARYLGIEKSMFSLLMNGKRNPGLTTAIEIERKTGIPVEAWSTLGDDSASAESATSDKSSVNS